MKQTKGRYVKASFQFRQGAKVLSRVVVTVREEHPRKDGIFQKRMQQEHQRLLAGCQVPRPVLYKISQEWRAV